MIFSSGNVSGSVDKRIGYLACTVMFLKGKLWVAERLEGSDDTGCV